MCRSSLYIYTMVWKRFFFAPTWIYFIQNSFRSSNNTTKATRTVFIHLFVLLCHQRCDVILATSCYKSCPSILIVFLWILTTGNSKLFDVVLTELLTGGFGFQARLTHRSTGHSPTRFEDHQGECFRRVSAVFRLVTISGMLFSAHVFRIVES